MNRLGHILLDGKITGKGPAGSGAPVHEAAEAGHAQSMVDIGVMYANGIGVQADLGKAAMWYNRAADLGNPAGMVNLGWLYEYGKGVEMDVCQGRDVVPAGGRSRQRLRHDEPRTALRQREGRAEDDEAAVAALNRKAA